MRRVVVVSSLGLLIVALFAGCGEEAFFASDGATAQSAEALRAPSLSDRPLVDDGLYCPFELDEVEADEEPVRGAPAFIAADDRRADDVIAYQPRIEVELEVQPRGDFLDLKVSFYNPYRCHWAGHLYLEQEDGAGNVRTIGRRYNYLIRGGTRVGGHIIINQPPPNQGYHFAARAYSPDGADQRTYVNCLLSATDADPAICADIVEDTDEPVRSEDVVEEVWEEEAPSDLIAAELPDCSVERLPPIRVGLRLRGHGRYVEMLSMWQNQTRTGWGGDLYVEYTSPRRGVQIVRRDLNRRIPAGVGFCMWDRTRLPGAGVYRFAARALHRDGSAEARWFHAGTTEINAVCNGEICERIEPDQRRAGIELKGGSTIHLVSNFFSEFTRVTMAVPAAETDVVASREIDITDRCEIRQRWSGGQNYIEVHFDTRRLPVGPNTWANYTVELHPMPIVPEGSKLSDSLLILTHGTELCDSSLDCD